MSLLIFLIALVPGVLVCLAGRHLRNVCREVLSPEERWAQER